MIAILLAVVITWPEFFAHATPHGLEYSAKLHQLAGTRVVLRGYSVAKPAIDGGILLTHFPYSEPHDLDETDVPYDAVAVIWRKGIALPPIPRRPTIEGTLRLGNRSHSGQMTAVTLEDAVPASKEVTQSQRR